jgi:hypothetical protein
MGGSVGLLLTVIVWTALLPGAIVPEYTDPPTLMAATGSEHRIRRAIHPIVMRDRVRESEKGFTSGQLLIILLHTYNP